jgi:serine/threonine protein kinase
MKPDFHKVNLPNSIWTIRQQYQQLQYLGCGTFGQVCSAHDQNTNTTIAIKKISQPFLSPEHAKRVYREVKLLQHMDHENIIKILDVFTPSEDCESFSEIYLVSQLMDRDLK